MTRQSMQWTKWAGVAAAGVFLVACGPPSQPPAPPDVLIADPPPTESGLMPGAGQSDFDRAQAFVKQGAFDKAIPALERTLQVQPNNAQAWYYHGLSLEQTGRRAQAPQSYQRAIALSAELVEPRINLAAIFLEPPVQAPKAIALLQEALKLQPKAADVHENLGYAFSLTRDYASSAKHYKQAIAIAPNPLLSIEYGHALFAQRKFEQAAAQYKKGLVAVKDRLDVVEQLARRFGAAKAYGDCIEAFGMVLAKRPAAPTYVKRGLCRHGMKDEAGARADYQAALGLNPGSQAAHYYLAMSFLAEKRREDAAKSLEQVLKLGSETPFGKRARKKYDGLIEDLKRRNRR